ncbi:hypothetical protein FA95DRAFT_1534184 [Auriscalpium vulgare]|uniref:Uncharacterized protein n=1 Tax=Auriscalpium vulgare TaxID=40419 RepID=A0ACB8S6R2_9AGAM|nr:hypothetical protein FA95DRAFT_1534184 [Auriscalpium vulgare]
MSLADLTRNSFQSGIPPAKWVGLCKLFLAKQPRHTIEDSGRAISNSVLILFSSYAGDPSLQGYLKEAIQSDLLSLPIFVTTFLQAARSPELHNAATLDILCRIAIDAQFASGPNPMSTVILFSEGPDLVLATIRDGLVLLKTAYTLPISHFHRLIESVGELLIMLLNSVADVSKASNAQVAACVDDAKGVLQLFPLNPVVRMALEKFVVSLSSFADADIMGQHQIVPLHSSLTKGDILAPSPENDIVSCSLVLYHLVVDRSKDYGAGDGVNATAVLISAYRVTFWTLPKFYVQLFLSAITCLSQDLSPLARKLNLSIWRAFVIGRLPRLLVSFEKALEAEGVSSADSRSAIRDAWGMICSGGQPLTSLLAQYEASLAMVNGQDQLGESMDKTSSFTRTFTHQLLSLGIIDQAFVARSDPTLPNDNTSRLISEARDAGVDLEMYLGSKLSADNGDDDINALLERIYADFSCHATFAEIIKKRFAALSVNYDVDTLSHLARVLYNNEFALEVVSLHVKVSDLVAHALVVLEEYDTETVGDPQTAVSHLGDIVIFLQVTVTRFNLSHGTLHFRDKRLDLNFLRTTHLVHRPSSLQGERRGALAVWSKALFDKNSEGIEDGILRSTRPKTLLALAATLCCSAISACAEHKIDPEVLSNGISYFLSPLLNWTLVGIVQALLREVRMTRFHSLQHLNVLRVLLLSPTFPPPVMRLCGLSVLRLFSEPSLQQFIPQIPEVAAIKTTVSKALGFPEAGPSQLSPSIAGPAAPVEPALQAIRAAIAQMQSGKAPAIDVPACLHVTSPTRFLRLLWAQLSAAVGVHINLDAAKCLAVFVLATPRTPRTPPLLPIFLHNMFPSLIDAIDEDKQRAAQSVAAELLVTVVASSVMSALYLERAVFAASRQQRHPLGESSIAMARRLAAELRLRKSSPTAKLIAERLASSATFVASFPVFKTEL